MENIENTNNEENNKAVNNNGGSNKNGGKKVLKGAIAATSAVVLLGAGIFIGSKFFGNTPVNVNNNDVQNGNIVAGNTENKTKISQDYIGRWSNKDITNWVEISSIDGNKVKFTCQIRHSGVWESLATLEDDNTAVFTDPEGKIGIEGKLIFGDESVSIEITKSEDAYIQDIPKGYKETYTYKNLIKELTQEYVGIWKDENNNSVKINSINDKKINFELSINGKETFADIEATLIKDYEATFKINKDTNIEGKIKFGDSVEAVSIEITKSDSVDLPVGYKFLSRNKQDSNTSTTQQVSNSETNKDSNINNSNYAKEYIKIIDKVKADYPNSEIKCDLIYFNNDNIPDLVIGIPWYWVSLYMYEDGKVYNPIDNWAYGAGGNSGYKYIEKKGIVSNHNSDYAGGVSTDSLLILNLNKEFDVLSNRGKGADIESTNPMYEEIQKDLKETAGYYYNGNKISEQEYNNRLRELSVSVDNKDYKMLDGDSSIEEVKKQLQE